MIGVLAVILIPQIAILLTGLIYPAIQHHDPDGSFLYLSIHHLFQLLLTILAMMALSKRTNLKDWGFNLRNFKESWKWIGLFLLVFLAIEFFRIRGNLPIESEYSLTTKNKLGIQFFQYLLSGLGEEPLFRGLIMVYLARNWNRVFSLGKVQVPITVLIATLLFMLAHLDFDLTQMTVSGFDFDQQMKALQMGLLYGLAFFYTKSLLAPIVIHGLSNGIQFTLMYHVLS